MSSLVSGSDMAGIGLELQHDPIEEQRNEIPGRGFGAGIIDIAAKASDFDRAFAAEALGGLGSDCRDRHRHSRCRQPTSR